MSSGVRDIVGFRLEFNKTETASSPILYFTSVNVLTLVLLMQILYSRGFVLQNGINNFEVLTCYT